MTTRCTPRPFHLLCAGAVLGVSLCSSVAAARPAPADDVRYVIHVSVDGLRADAAPRLGPAAAPQFYRLLIEGASTANARCDCDYSVTLPNHACELTSRPVLGPGGHGLDYNSDDGRTLAEIHGSYVAGVFDVAHDHGLATGMYASKSKFALFDRSWDGANGAPDTTGADNGRGKIDTYVYDPNTTALITTFRVNMIAYPHRYAFLHLSDLDAGGHSYGWESKQYFDALQMIDGLLGRIFDLVDTDPELAGKTYIVVTADHGGTGTDHSDAANPAVYTIPFFVWGPGVPAGADLYALNDAIRQDPGTGRPAYGPVTQPIRNGETANLSLDLLDLPHVPGSLIDAAQDLEAVLPGGAGALPSVSITSPAPGTTLPYPSSVVIEAAADPGAGAIARVEFFENSIPLGVDSTSPYAYAWNRIPLGTYRITARAVRDDGAASTASVELEITSTADVPAGHSMLPGPPLVYPNPFDRFSTIQVSLAASDAVEIGIFDLLARRLGTVGRGLLGEGLHELSFDAAGYSPGIYFLSVRSRSETRTGKLMIVR